MVDPSEIAGDVITGATALAGLILVYLGSIAAGYGSYGVEQQHSVLPAFRKRAWFGFWGLVLALVAAATALVGKWADLDWLTTIAGLALLISFGWGIATAFLTVQEVK